MPAVEARKPTAAGRKWLRSYFNGCAFKVFDAPLPPSLTGRPFLPAAEWLFRSSGLALIGASPCALLALRVDAPMMCAVAPAAAIRLNWLSEHPSGIKPSTAAGLRPELWWHEAGRGLPQASSGRGTSC